MLYSLGRDEISGHGVGMCLYLLSTDCDCCPIEHRGISRRSPASVDGTIGRNIQPLRSRGPEASAADHRLARKLIRPFQSPRMPIHLLDDIRNRHLGSIKLHLLAIL